MIDQIVELTRNLIGNFNRIEDPLVENLLDGIYRTFFLVALSILFLMGIGVIARHYGYSGINIAFGFITIILGFMSSFYHRYLIRYLTAGLITSSIPYNNEPYAQKVASWCKQYIKIVRYFLGGTTAIFFLLAIFPQGIGDGYLLAALLGIICLCIIPKE